MAAAAAVAAVAAGGADGAAAAMQKGLPIITEKSDTQVLPAKSSYLAQDIFFKKNLRFSIFRASRHQTCPPANYGFHSFCTHFPPICNNKYFALIHIATHMQPPSLIHYTPTLLISSRMILRNSINGSHVCMSGGGFACHQNKQRRWGAIHHKNILLMSRLVTREKGGGVDKLVRNCFSLSSRSSNTIREFV